MNSGGAPAGTRLGTGPVPPRGDTLTRGIGAAGAAGTTGTTGDGALFRDAGRRFDARFGAGDRRARYTRLAAPRARDCLRRRTGGRDDTRDGVDCLLTARVGAEAPSGVARVISAAIAATTAATAIARADHRVSQCRAAPRPAAGGAASSNDAQAAAGAKMPAGPRRSPQLFAARGLAKMFSRGGLMASAPLASNEGSVAIASQSDEPRMWPP
jgi:hypothetical protein